MSNFAVGLLCITVIPHPNADALDLALVGPPETAYRCVIGKGQFKTGDLVAYIPEAAILPEDLIAEMGLTGKLHGSGKNRVKAVKLRGEVSQGLVWAPKEGWKAWFEANRPDEALIEGSEATDIEAFEGMDIAEPLGITKYQPVIPVHMRGKMQGDAPSFALSTDMENFKKYSDLFKNGELVYATEKVHGTQMSLIYDGKDLKVSSKGVLMRNRATLAEEPGNLYWKAVRDHGLEGVMQRLYAHFHTTVQLVGEVYGDVQDLKYGCAPGERRFAAFDLRLCNPDNTGTYVNSEDFFILCREVGVETVPLIFVGAFDLESIKFVTSGKTTYGGQHIREGVVLKPAQERIDYRHGRVILKSVSDAYLTRKGEVTELE